MRWLSWVNKPWIHFLVLGVLLFNLQAWMYPPPKPVVGPLAEARIEALQQQWQDTTGRPPSQEQLTRMIAAELDRDMLFQRALAYELHLYDTVVYQRLLRNMRFLQLGEDKTDQELYEQALEMRLHLGDEVVKRRMIQVMEQLLLSASPPLAVTDVEIAAEFDARSEELRLPPRYSISHLYFTTEREAEITEVIEAIEEQDLDAQAARKMSSPFLPGYEFKVQTPDQLARHFGTAFVTNLQESQPVAGHWLGPIRSTYGQHYVWVEAIEPERDASLEEVKTRLIRDLESRARTEALAQAIASLRDQFEVRS
jgi:parvulin-like peptidyl-prolyl isomerase